MNSNIFIFSLLLANFSMAASLKCYNNFDGFKDGKISVSDKYTTPACSPAVKKMCIKGECDGIKFYSCTDTDDICKAYLSGCKSCTATSCTEDLCNDPNANQNTGNQKKLAEGEKPKKQKPDEKKPVFFVFFSSADAPADGKKSDGKKPDVLTDGADTTSVYAIMMLAIGLVSVDGCRRHSHLMGQKMMKKYDLTIRKKNHIQIQIPIFIM